MLTGQVHVQTIVTNCTLSAISNKVMSNRASGVVGLFVGSEIDSVSSGLRLNNILFWTVKTELYHCPEFCFMRDGINFQTPNIYI